ncbi:hypothetical protein J5N97_015889 [Dioscorea zingiberensis]|uniref:Uncharacterized protein n=1 Tax=Dioscorea zingiberensis TaxID=325984 RepID=A0A9D5HEV4_9LILI|nr:hypothetical protein J5N97_015889 [Dioscorea zingiberensis]
MGRPHALLLPYPAQGHVLPLMELAHGMVSHGFTITFINTHFNHARLLSAMPTTYNTNPSINFISIPDGLQPGDDRNHVANLCKALMTIMPLHLEELIIKMMHEQPEHDKPTCLIADETMAWAFDVAKKTGLRTAAFWPASAATFTSMRNIPKLIQDGIIHQHDGRPFLWVVRPDITGKAIINLPKGFKDRIGDRGMVVQWSPQQEVLAHPAVSCFMSHCGWNSTMEGVSNGVPFLCWPYFADQHLNQTYICDVWKTGLKMIPDENNMITKDQIRDKVEELLGDGEMKKRALEMKEMATKGVDKGGSSFQNFNTFVSAMQV